MTLVAAVPDGDTSERERQAGWAGRLEAIDAFLMLLAKAVRQVHAYPLSSQVCVDAVNACLAHLVTIEGSDEVAIVVAPDALVAHDHPVGEAIFITQELSRRLRRARVADFSVHREATTRDLTRFCAGVVRCSESGDRSLSVADLLLEDGIDAVSVTITSRREVLDVGAAAPAQRDLVAHERRRREEADSTNTHVVHLFPAHRGWIRLDPSESYEGLSLADLAILVDDPSQLAAMLDRLVEDTIPDGVDTHALEHRFSDVASLFAGLEPRLSRVMFAKLAGSVLALDTAPRHALLKRTILPTIFDGRHAAKVLTAFPDADLAESLCLLFDLETSVPAVMSSALDQLNLEPERRASVFEMMQEIVRVQQESSGGLDPGTALAMDQHARRLTRIDAAERRSFVELAGFEFRLDDQAVESISTVRGSIHHADAIVIELACLTNLVHLQPNPEVAEPFMRAAVQRTATLVTDGRWEDLASALERFAAVTASLNTRRPEVSALVEATLTAFATADVATALLARHTQGAEGEATALRIIDALGTAIAPALLSILTGESAGAAEAVTLMSERATLFAPMLADIVATSPRSSRHHIARVLGHAGSGYEDFLGAMIEPGDERAAREALRGLSRIGTARAAALVCAAARDARGWMTTATIETLLRYPPEVLAPVMRELLGHRPFVLAQPEAAARLLGRAGKAKDQSLDPVLKELWSLRFRFWNRPLVRMARDAGALVNSQ